MKNILITIAAFLLIWFYIQPFAKDVDTIVDSMIYTQEEKKSDSLAATYKAEVKRLEDSVALADSIIISQLDSIDQTRFGQILKALE